MNNNNTMMAAARPVAISKTGGASDSATPGSSAAAAPVQMPSERTQEDLELAARLIEHSQGGRVNSREQAASAQSQPTSNTPPAERRPSPVSTDGEGSRSTGDADEQARLSDDGYSNQNLSLPSIHELTWVKQRKPFNTGMGGAGQVCRYVHVASQCLYETNTDSDKQLRHHSNTALETIASRRHHLQRLWPVPESPEPDATRQPQARLARPIQHAGPDRPARARHFTQGSYWRRNLCHG